MNKITFALASIIIFGVISGVILSFNLTYESELKEHVMPEADFGELSDLFKNSTEHILRDYSVDALLKYTKSENPNAKINFQYALNSYSEQFGNLVSCNEAPLAYFKEYRLFNNSEYYWKWKSLCEFEKRKGYATFKFTKSNTGWVVSVFGIEKL